MGLFNMTSLTTFNTSTLAPKVSPTRYDGYKGENIVSAVFYSILACVVVVGNGMVIIAFKVNYKLRTVTNLCFVSLAVCDFLVGIISIPLWIHYTFNTFNPATSNRHLYLFFISFDIFNGAASIFQLTAISLERCFSIVAPVRHHSMSVSFYYVMVFAVWLLAAFSSLLRLLPYNNLTDAGWYNVYTIFVCFVAPVVIMSTSYVLLFRTAMKRSQLNMRTSKNIQMSLSSQLKTVVTLLIVTGLFVVAWSPFFTVVTLSRYKPRALPSSVKDMTHLWRFVKWMHYSNSSINPFVYAFRNREFHYSFRMIIQACIKCKRFDEVNRQFRRPNRFHLRQHTREVITNSQSSCRVSSLRKDSSSTRSARETTTTSGGSKHKGDLQTDTITTQEIELDIINSNIKV